MKRYYFQKSLQNAKALRTNQSDAENILWFYLRNRRLNNIKVRRQVPIGKYIADFFIAEKKLIIELDGSQHIENQNIKYDEIRTQTFEKLGFTVIRINNNEIFNNIDNVLEYIVNTYNNIK